MRSPEKISADLCVIGAGSGGLSVAAGAAQMGARVVLIEKGAMGGDCLNHGCVPSKALLAAAKAAEAHRACARFGVAPDEPAIDFQAVKAHIRGVMAAIAPHDSQERFEGLGVRVIRAAGAFVSPREVSAGGALIRARRFVIATGSRPAIPPIEGLESVPYLTNETLFSLPERPSRLAVIGAGPIGLEMAQAFRRLGSEVTVLERARALPKDDPELVAVVLARLRAEGVDLREEVAVSGVRAASAAGEVLGAAPVMIDFEGGASIEASHLLVAAGRRPNIEGLGLEAAGIAHTPGGVTVDSGLRTSNRRVFAVGDAACGPGAGLRFTHMAGYHAGVVARRALFRLPATACSAHVPWVTYTDPELAQIGLTEAAAREKLGDRLRVVSWSYEDNDRAQAERRTEGRLKAILDDRGRIHGAGVVGAQAGELIQIWALALAKGLTIKDLTGMVAPYPTFGEVSKRAAGQFFAPKLFSPLTRWVVRQLLRLG